MKSTEKKHLDKYLILLSEFTKNKITAPEFEKQYLYIYKNDNYKYSEKIHIVLATLFSDVDSYCSIPEIRDSEDLNEEQLLQEVDIALKELTSI
jgi:hypothetical protein